MDWLLYDRGLRHERVNIATTHNWINTTLIHEKLRMTMYDKVIKAALP